MSSRRANPDEILDPFACFHPVTAEWFKAVFDAPTAPQRMGWPVIARGESALILAPTGTGKTLAAFLWCLDRLMLHPRPEGEREGCRIVYVSPLKALAVDVERNLCSPLAGIANMARRRGVPFHEPSIAVRTGDTPQRERARFQRHPAEILITTPESLYLLLTSQASEALRTVDTVIIDEIHALVPTKRGAHLALSLERLEALTQRRLQRIGLSATQRPLEEVARFLGGVEVRAGAEPTEVPQAAAEATPASWSSDLADPAPLRYRPVTIVNASALKQLKLRIEVPVEDMARLGTQEELPSGPASQAPRRVSIWNAIHPRLLELIRERNSTILFVNSRQVAERLAGALNELAGEAIARAHHGSLAAAQRSIIEEQLKAGQIRALCATSTLELGIDMGAVDLVIQIEAPPSVASGMQRIGRAGHHVDAVSEGILFPKYRADLVACAAVTRAMHEGHIESTRFPRNPLDVLAQQLVAIVAHPPSAAKPSRSKKPRRILPGAELPAEPKPEVSVDALFDLVRSAAPFGGLTRSAFEGVLDLLSGRYHRPRRRGPVGHSQRRNHSGPRPLRRLPGPLGGQVGARRRTGRGDGLRVSSRRDLHFGRLHLAHRRDYPRPCAGDAGTRRTGQDAFLEGGWSGKATGVRPPHRSTGAGTPRPSQASCLDSPGCRARPRPRRGGELDGVPCRPGSRHRPGSRRPHGGHRALPR
jgi:ATP-dependent Lhr-like helicase